MRQGLLRQGYFQILRALHELCFLSQPATWHSACAVADSAACLLQSLVAPLVSAAECSRPGGAATCTYEPDQACTGRLATDSGMSGNASSAGDLSRNATGRLQSSLVQRAHRLDLVVHAYTFRNEVSLPSNSSKPVWPGIRGCLAPLQILSPGWEA